MFERFTERARVVIVLAQEEARTLRHNYIGTEHILLGLLREEEGLAARVLQSLEITAERVRAQVVEIVGPGEDVASGQIPFTPRAKRVLERALREAMSLGHNHIGTEHILLGLLPENDGVAMRILLELGGDTRQIRDEVTQVLSVPGGQPGEPARVTAAGAPVAYMGVPRPPLDWTRATVLWRPEGLELRVPLHLTEAAIAAFASDEAWANPPLAGIRREIWDGWVALASPRLMEDKDPVELRQALEGAAQRALDRNQGEPGRVEDFLRRLREAE